MPDSIPRHLHPDRRDLSTLEVRPIFHEERERWDSLMATHHYLGNSRSIGLRHVAVLDSHWVALCGWQAAVLQSRPRDGLIGWHAAVRRQGLPYIANNARFVILPEWHLPNLASKVLSQITKRLPGDWEAVYGWRVVLAETFVDPARFQGKSYVAAGWKCIGETSGYKRDAKTYFEYTGEKKLTFVKPLVANAAGVLANPLLHPYKAFQKLDMATYMLTTKEVNRLYDYLRMIPDRRKRRGVRHTHISILTIVLGAILSGRKSVLGIAEWAKDCPQSMLRQMFCKIDPKTGRYSAPSEPTIRRTLNDLDVEAADQLLGAWARDHAIISDDAIAIDGKTLKGTGKGEARAIQLVAALLHKDKLVIAQTEVHPSTNEQKTVMPLLKNLNIENRTVTLDAAHTYEETARYLVEDKKADYLLTVKDNQPNLRQELDDLHLEDFPPGGRNSGKGTRQN